MRITHIGLYAQDIEKEKNFYAKYFKGVPNVKYVNAKGFQSYFLSFDGNVKLEIMAHKELQTREQIDKVNGLSHVAFSVGSEGEVKRLTERLVSDGYEMLSPPRRTGDGYFESCIADPEGNRVEITAW